MSEMSEGQDVQLVIHSAALFSGVTKGFGLIFTQDRVIGSKDYATSGDEQVKIGGTFGSRITGAKEIGEFVSEVLEKFAPGKVTR